MPIESRLLRRLTDGVCDLLFPPRCVGCDTLLPPLPDGDTILCPVCRTVWETARAEAAAPAAEALGYGHAFAILYHSGHTDGVPERVIYHLKHIGSPRVFAFVASALAPRVQTMLKAATAAMTDPLDASEAIDAPAMTAVLSQPPLFTYPPRRRRAVSEDGFDQAARLATALATACGGECRPLLRRTRRPSAEQKRLDTSDRKANAAASYALRPHVESAIRDRIVILCDDLSTTGATLSRCSDLLVEAGAARILWVTVGQTKHPASPS